jgi:hypothetical protein
MAARNIGHEARATQFEMLDDDQGGSDVGQQREEERAGAR